MPLFCPLDLNDLEIPDLVIVTLFQLFRDVQIDPSCHTAVFVAEPSRDRINGYSACQQQGGVCMPEGVGGQLPAEDFQRYFFQLLVVAVVIDTSPTLIREEQLRSVAQKDTLFPDIDVDLPAQLEQLRLHIHVSDRAE